MMNLIKFFVLISLSCAASFARVYTFDVIESRTKVAVIDTGIHAYSDIKPFLCNDKHYDFSGTNLQDTNGHGTNIAAIIVKGLRATDICIQIVKYTAGGIEVDKRSYIRALKQAVSDPQVKYINLSSGGIGSLPEERQILSDALKAGKFIIVSAGNNGEALSMGCHEFPACYFFMSSNFRVVGNGTNANHRHFSSNYGFAVTDWVKGITVCAGETEKGTPICFSGTSQSAAIITNKLIKQHLNK